MDKTMTSRKAIVRRISSTVGQLLLILTTVNFEALLFAQTVQQDEGPGGRHICPVEAIRKGTCDPNPGQKRGSTGASVNAPKKTAMYKRVAKQADTSSDCNSRLKAIRLAATKNATPCDAPGRLNQKEDLPISSQSVGITIWKVRDVQPGYSGARILWHRDQSGSAVEYQAERLAGDPVLAYGEKVRLGIESRRDGYLYVFDRELYADGSMSAAYLIFPTARLHAGNNRIIANRPVELPSLTDVPFFFEAKKVGIDPGKTLVGEILSIVITDKPIVQFNSVDRNVVQVPAREIESIETLYSGVAEVFELENGEGQPYTEVERDAAKQGARLLTHADPVPQTFYLIKSKHSGGLLVTLALTYKEVGTPRMR
jgi:Domain of unknown function (DUF4384)